MAKTNHLKIISVPSLKTQGFALQYFPGYINRSKQLHSVNEVLLSFVIQGKGTHYLGNHAYPEKGPSLSITHYGQVHDIVTTETGMDVMNIYLDLKHHALPDLPPGYQEALHQILPPHPNFFATPDHMTRIEFDPDTPAVPLALMMHQESLSNHPDKSSMQRQYLVLFLMECCRSVKERGILIQGSGGIGLAKSMEPIRQFLDKHFTESLTLIDLVKYSGYSGPYLCRIFKEYTGKTIYGYLLDKRLQAAMTHLRQTDMKISALALDAGFSDLSFFNKLFKRRLGITPRQYRMHQ